ncbi:hypothetical protein [Anaerocolumna sp. MB42-C2]|uniref:hypothetical protein n=1 Tax=Anaerocolumna sp. MB42-C2 TaxID=3070997 RepID=UPI0027DF6E0D|nr:hypothetical protein [Anaerocolumna sp. MB42-C2]WMJ89844.1 hypothetical protein RBU59_10040 [Anaerocolumna sp. MB42-C2]
MTRKEKYMAMYEEREIKHKQLSNEIMRFEEEEELKAEMIFYEQCYNAGLGDDYLEKGKRFEKIIEEIKNKEIESLKLKKEMDILKKLLMETAELKVV